MLVRVRSPRSAPLFLEEEENGTVPRCAEPVDRSCDKRRGFVSRRAIGAREGQREKEVKMVRVRKAERRKKGESASHLLGDLRGRGVPSFLISRSFPSCLRWISRASFERITVNQLDTPSQTCSDRASASVSSTLSRFGSVCWTGRILYSSVSPNIGIRVFGEGLRGWLVVVRAVES